jgi:hypothetical protein
VTWGRGQRWGVVALLLAASFFWAGLVQAGEDDPWLFYGSSGLSSINVCTTPLGEAQPARSTVEGHYAATIDEHEACIEAAMPGLDPRNHRLLEGSSVNWYGTNNPRRLQVIDYGSRSDHTMQWVQILCSQGSTHPVCDSWPPEPEEAKPDGWPLLLLCDTPSQCTNQVCEGGTVYNQTSPIIEEPSGRYSALYGSSGESCTGSPGTGQTATEGASSDDFSCITSEAGNVMCRGKDPGPSNCGYVNDEYMCLDKVPAGNCIILPGGSYACDATASTPPAPNSGLPGVPAAKDDTIWSKDGGSLRQYNYYHHTTVNNSTTHTGLPVDGETGELGDDTADDMPPVPDLSGVGGLDDLVGDVVGSLGSEDPVGTPDGLRDALLNLLPSSGGCQTLAISFLGQSYDFPGANGCARLDKLKQIIGWALVVYLLYTLIGIATRPVPG